MRLLFRFFDPDTGKITIDGKNVRALQLESLRKAIGVVPQDIVLFNSSIYYNIAYGRPSATRFEVEEAARKADIHNLIMGLPEKYETRVGERGLMLSGGEKQRVAISRVLLKEPSILLFDEPTSALDTVTEHKILSELNALSKGKTSIIIAHRLSTVKDADEIIVLGGPQTKHAPDSDRSDPEGYWTGRIVERGRHSDLLNIPGGTYASMWQSQQVFDDTKLDSP
jgi:ABC-type transport system involved in Fe-S cluster assembly fused permease/ATPase subunit